MSAPTGETVLPELPTRDEYCQGMPEPFAKPQLDRCTPAFALTADGPVVSCDAWSDRRLARLDDAGVWRPLTPAGRWYRELRWAGGKLLALSHGRGDDGADCRVETLTPAAEGWARLSSRPGRLGAVTAWNGDRTAERSPAGDASTLDPAGAVVGVERQADGTGRVVWDGGAVIVPAGALVQDVTISPDGRRLVLVTRGPDGVSARCHDVDGGEEGPVLSAPLVGAGVWATDDLLAVRVSRWPAILPCWWDVRTGELTAATAERLGVCESIDVRDGVLGYTWATAEQPRHLRLTGLQGLGPLDPGLPERSGSTSVRLLAGGGGPLPCLVQDPPGERIGTVLLFHGGPNGSHFASWSPIAESLQLAGWRVVRPNIRGSAVRDTGLRPGLPDTYGVEDLADAVTVLDAFADDRVVAGGTSYGGYLAGRLAAVTGRVAGVFMIGGFLRFADLRASEHPFTRAFLRSPRVRETLDDRPDPAQRYLIIHGERDERTPLTALTRNLPVLPRAVVVELPGEGHGLTTDAAARVAIPALFEWLDRC